MAKGHKAPVTLRALFARINRKLAADGMALRAARGRYGGHHYLLDKKRNIIKPLDEDVEAYARRIGALEAWEEIV